MAAALKRARIGSSNAYLVRVQPDVRKGTHIAEIASALAGSSHHRPNKVFAASPNNTAAARMAHSTFCVPLAVGGARSQLFADPLFCAAKPRAQHEGAGSERDAEP